MRLAYDVTQLLMAQTASNAGVGKAAPKAPKQASNEVQKVKNRPLTKNIAKFGVARTKKYPLRHHAGQR